MLRKTSFTTLTSCILLFASTAAAQVEPIERTYLKASNSDQNDQFGTEVAISGDTFVVGSPFEDSDALGVNGDQSDNSAFAAGAAYVFVSNGSNWIQEAYLKASNAEGAPVTFFNGDSFGTAVAISGDTLVVGAPGEDSNATGVNGDQTDNSLSAAGAAYVFVRSGSTWTQQAYLKASNAGIFDAFGRSVAISGDTIVVGAWGECSNASGVDGDQSDNSLNQAGAAYVFTRSGTTWTQSAYLKATSTDQEDRFGWSVAVSDDTVVVGARDEDSLTVGINGDATNNGSLDTGAAYVFVRSGSIWSQQAYLKASNTDAADQFGYSVSISGHTVVVGAWGEDSVATGINGDQASDIRPNTGAAYVFTRSGSTWSQEAYIKAVDTDLGDRFGVDVDLIGDELIVGALFESSSTTVIDGDGTDNSADDSGAAYKFSRTGTTWSQDAYLKASNTGANDQFGSTVAISSDVTVVGAFFEGSNATGINGDETDNSAGSSGAVYLFDEGLKTLTSDDASISLLAGGQQALALDGGVSRANWFYFVFGSVTGTSPGLDFGNGIILPLNFDAYFNLTLTKPGLGAFANFRGQLDGTGTALATLTLPPALDPTLAGVTIHHAYLAAETLGIAEFASNAVPVLLVP